MKLRDQPLSLLRWLIFASRWLQAPLYIGLIFTLGIYVYHFGIATSHLLQVKAGQSQCIDVPGKASTISTLLAEYLQSQWPIQTGLCIHRVPKPQKASLYS